MREALHYCCEFASLGCRSLPLALQEDGSTAKPNLTPDPLWGQAQDLASHYLKQPQLTINQIAHLMDYAEASAFTLAFKGWTGQTPQQYRQVL